MRWKACRLARRGPRRATKRGSHSRRMPTSRCTPTSTVAGPLIAPPTPGIGMNAGRIETNSSMPNTWRLRPARMSAIRRWSSPSPLASASSSSRVPGTPVAARWTDRSVSTVAGTHTLHQQLVDPGAVQVDHLDAPAAPFEGFADVGDPPEARDHHAGGGVVVVVVLARQRAAADQLAHRLHRGAAVHQQRAVVAGGDLRDGVGAFAGLGAAD